MNLQARMNQAFEDYFALSKALNSDVEMFLDINESGLIKDSDIRWKRNFVRTLPAVIEGYNHCIRRIAKCEFKCKLQKLSKMELKVIVCECNSNTRERIKYTLSGSFKIFNFPLPDFGTEDWENAQEGLKRRDQFMHPKFPADLEIASDSWARIDSGLIWLLKQHMDFSQHLQKRIPIA